MSKKLLVVGGSGSLGSALVRRFNPTFNVTNIDFTINIDCQDNIVLDPCKNPSQSLPILREHIKDQRFDSIICTAGGWAGDSIGSPEFIDTMQKMMSMNFWSTVTAAELARSNLIEEGIFISTGASLVFKEPCPTMLSYALSKNLVHNLHQILLYDPEFVEKQIHSICILPTVLDTKNNRSGNPDADYSCWLKPDKVAELLYMWVNSNNLPDNGAFINLEEKNGMLETTFF